MTARFTTKGGSTMEATVNLSARISPEVGDMLQEIMKAGEFKTVRAMLETIIKKYHNDNVDSSQQ